MSNAEKIILKLFLRKALALPDIIKGKHLISAMTSFWGSQTKVRRSVPMPSMPFTHPGRFSDMGGDFHGKKGTAERISLALIHSIRS